ncbi:MAG: glycosyltransferase family 2 protein [Lewinellaceae bacterium]|nr:glycosyltransferase family 2 protein [Lewinellaceae bacterium]
MLSILIPVYQFDVRSLVRALLEQASHLPEAWEIVCFDDGSTEDFREMNREMEKWPGVRYEELPENLGRSRIRNKLAQAANYPYLLFMDCDGMPQDQGFLATYLAACRPGQVVVGTRAYPDAPPQDTDRYFHWFYGREREQRPAAERNRQPYDAFCTFHFLCPRDIFLRILLDESLRQYGHEDTQFGYELRKRNIPLIHIDTALLHLDIEPTDVFLRKTRQGIENLVYLSRKNPEIGSRLLQAFWRLRPLSPLLGLIYRLGRKAMERQFHSRRPSLRLFDLYKLGYLARLQTGWPSP